MGLFSWLFKSAAKRVILKENEKFLITPSDTAEVYKVKVLDDDYLKRAWEGIYALERMVDTLNDDSSLGRLVSPHSSPYRVKLKLTPAGIKGLLAIFNLTKSPEDMLGMEKWGNFQIITFIRRTLYAQLIESVVFDDVDLQNEVLNLRNLEIYSVRRPVDFGNTYAFTKIFRDVLREVTMDYCQRNAREPKLKIT